MMNNSITIIEIVSAEKTHFNPLYSYSILWRGIPEINNQKEDAKT